MRERDLRCTRRKFLASAAALTMSGGLAPAASSEKAIPSEKASNQVSRPSREGRQPIAVVCTVYRPMSHAYHLAGRFLHGYTRQGVLHVPRQYVASMYVDQTPENDLSRKIGREFDVNVTRSISEAILSKDGKLAVSGVLLLGEHGNYPRNDNGQILYPRYEMLEQITAVFRKTCRSVPVYSANHLSYDWERAKKMTAWAADMRFALMAGSSLPVTWRRPELELPLGVGLQDGLVAGFGPIEVYGSHALEALQVMMERRQGGETGVKAVTCLTGKEVWNAGEKGLWSWDLLNAALSRSETVNPGDIRKNVGSLVVQSMPATPATAFLIEYRDGARGTILLLNGHVQDFCFAGKVQGESKAASCLFYMPGPPGVKHFDCLAANIENLFESGQSPYPIERTLLTTGVLAAAMESHVCRGKRVVTPHLDICYSAPVNSRFARGSVAAPT